MVTGYTEVEVQQAIWTLIEVDYTATEPDSFSIINQALAEGEGFVPDCGDSIAIIIDPVGDFQVTIGEMLISEIEGCPEIDVEKYVSIDGGINWYDADNPTGPLDLEGK